MDVVPWMFNFSPPFSPTRSPPQAHPKPVPSAVLFMAWSVSEWRMYLGRRMDLLKSIGGSVGRNGLSVRPVQY